MLFFLAIGMYALALIYGLFISKFILGISCIGSILLLLSIIYEKLEIGANIDGR